MAGMIAFSAFGCKKKKKTNGAGSEESMTEDTGRHEQHISILNVEMNAVKPQIYTSQPVVFDPGLTFERTELVEGTDYEISFSNNTLPGVAEMTISGKGVFTGVVKVPFRIGFDEDFCDDPLNADVLYFVKDAFEMFLGRLPTREEWVNYAKGLGMKSLFVVNLMETLLSSKEYENKNISDIDTLDKAYQLLMDRELTDEEKAEANNLLQSKSENALSILRSRLSSQQMIDACLKKRLHSVKLNLSEQELVSALSSVEGVKWLGNPIIDDFDGDGFPEAVREAGEETADGYVTSFWHTDGYNTYRFTQDKGTSQPETKTFTILNDGGKSFVHITAWPADASGKVKYNSRIIGLSRESYSSQCEGSFVNVSTHDVNTITLVMLDGSGASYELKLKYSEGKYVKSE